MARPGTQEQPTVEEMLVSIRQAIHGENAKTRSAPRSPSSPPKPPAVSGSMRQMRVSMKPNPTKTQSSVRTHSDNFQKLKRQLHDLDPLLGKQGRKSANEYRASTANGFAGILNGDVKLEEALAKLERAGLGDVQPESRPEPMQPSSPAPQPEAQLRGTESYEDESYEDEFDEYDFDPTSYDEPEVRQDVRVEQQFEDFDDVAENYDTQTPSYIQRAPAASPVLPPMSPQVAPPIATAPLAPPLVRTPSYGYDEPTQGLDYQDAAHSDQPYQQPAEPVVQHSLPPLPETMVQAPVEQPVMHQPVARPSPIATNPLVAPTIQSRTVAPATNTGLTSPEHARAASDAFASLAETIMHQATTGNRSIDDITKELLNPMLKGWLDENLPRMVERLIREEIERVARGGAR